MIIIISTILLLGGVLTLAMTDKQELGTLVIILTLLLGFGILGSLIEVKQVEKMYPATIACSSELGECRIKTEKETFTVISYEMVNKLLIDPVDSVKIILHLNSYGGIVSRKIAVQ